MVELNPPVPVAALGMIAPAYVAAPVVPGTVVAFVLPLKYLTATLVMASPATKVPLLTV